MLSPAGRCRCFGVVPGVVAVVVIELFQVVLLDSYQVASPLVLSHEIPSGWTSETA